MYIGEVGGNRVNSDTNVFTVPKRQFSDVLLKVHDESAVRTDFVKLFQKKYPGVTCHVGDISKFPNWDRGDFPVSQLFREKVSLKELENWQPATGCYDSAGIKSEAQRQAGSIAAGSRSIMIHPDVQAKMDGDSQYAAEIYRKIDRYFQKDIEINERILPGCTQGIIQFVSIDKDGNIDKTCSITNSVDRNDWDRGDSQKISKKQELSLLEDIKHTYSEKYFGPELYVRDMTGNLEREYGLRMGVFGESHQRWGKNN